VRHASSQIEDFMGGKSFLPTACWVRRGATAATLALVAGASCRTESGTVSERSPDSAAGTAASDVRQPVAGRYTLQDFARLRWLDGSWRGRLPDGGYFYERYRVMNDSTIGMRGFSDSLFARVTDSSSINFRGGTVTSEGGSRWVATRLEPSAVDFASERNAANNFTWVRESADRWTATLRSTDRDGRPRTIVYPMERVRR
jgi:hypothetical protein